MSEEVVDLVIIGAGPAGMAAACEAQLLGLDTVVLDEQANIGGQIYRNIENVPTDRLDVLGGDYADGRCLAQAFRKCGARYVGEAAVWNVTLDGVVDYIANGKTRTITGKHILLVSGAMERPFPIDGWTLPGVMGAGAGQILLKGSGALPAAPVVLAGCGPLLYLLAWQYLRAGVTIKALIDTTNLSAYLRAARYLLGALKGWRELAKGIKLLTALRRHGVPVYAGCSNLSIDGEGRVESVSFKHRGGTVAVPTKLALLHQGVVPNTQLTLSLGVEHEWNAGQLCWQPVTDPWGRLGKSSVYVAGDCKAIVGAQASAVQGRLAALAIGNELGAVTDIACRAAPLFRQLERFTHIRPFIDTLYRPLDENRIPKSDTTLICRCEEVTAGQIRHFVELGCLGPNQTKAFGRCGMGPCQGRFCGLTVTEIIAEARRVGPAEVGYYRIRPPIKPVMLGDFVP